MSRPRTTPLDRPAVAVSVAAFEARVLAEVPRLWRHATRRFGPGRDADVVQETLLLALQNRSQFRDSRPLWPWLRAIADRHAARLSERARLGPDALSEPDQLADPGAQIRGEAAEAVARLLARLAPDDEAVLRRHHLEGESVAELSESLGAPTGTIKARLWRARRRLIAIAGVASCGALAVLLWFGGRTGTQPHRHAPAGGTSVLRPAGNAPGVLAATIVARTVKVPVPARPQEHRGGGVTEITWRVLPPDADVQSPFNH